MAKDWWVVPEGTLGQLVDTFSLNGISHLFGALGNQAVWTVQQSDTKPPHSADEGPFSSQSQAQAAATALNEKEGILSDIQQLSGSADQPSSPSQLDSIPGLSQIGNFFGTLTQANTWERVGMGILGVMLIGVGVAKLTGADKVVEEAAKTAAVVVPK